MRRAETRLFVFALLTLFGTFVLLPPSSRAQQPPRDTSAGETKLPSGMITGRVLSADNARPVKRARVFITAPQLTEGRGVLTDDSGVFEFEELPEGRYTVTVSKTGFVSLSYGQRRPLQAGTPLQLADGQELRGIDFRLPRGSVIGGHVYDETGEPLPGANVRVMRYQYAQGNRQLVPAGAAESDDKGAFRIWGLNPGNYYVSAVVRNFTFGARGSTNAAGPGPGRGGRGRGGPPGLTGSRGVGGVAPPVATAAPNPEQVGYAPTFYPGVPSIEEARPVTVALGAESLDIDFGLLLVRTSRVSGRVTNPDGTDTSAGDLTLRLEAGPAGGRFGSTFNSRIQWDGTFAIGSVPPGRYILRARGDDAEVAQYAVLPLTVGDTDIPNVVVILAPGATVSGSVTLQNTRSAQPDVTQLRIAAPPTDSEGIGPNPTAKVARDGTFTIDGVPAGPHWIRTQGAMRGWMLKSVIVDGRDVIDTPLDLRSDQKLTGVTLLFTDKLTEVNGRVTDDRNQPLTDFTVLAFPVDPSLWRPQARQIVTARPDQNGKYQLRALPPGEYFLAAVDPAEQGEWFEPAFLDQHRPGAALLSIAEGDVKTQDFKISSR